MRIGLIGCGTVGRRLGLRLLRRGFAVRVHDAVRGQAGVLLAAGAEWADDPSALAVDRELIVSALPEAADVELAVAGENGCWAAAAARTLHVETSTLGPAAARRLAELAAQRGLRYLDGAISRGTATSGGVELVLWVGGHADYYDLARPVLQAMCDHVLYCGAVGHAQVTKLVNNLVAHSLTVIIGEALALGVRQGLSLDILRKALSDGTAQNRVLDELLPCSALVGDWRPGLRLTLADRDLGLAEDLAGDAGVRLTTIGAVRGLYREALERGWGDLSGHSVLRLIEESADVELRSPILRALGEQAVRNRPTEDEDRQP